MFPEFFTKYLRSLNPTENATSAIEVELCLNNSAAFFKRISFIRSYNEKRVERGVPIIDDGFSCISR